ncbi:hypothetical protein [Nocardioides sp.]|uniref:hypothetical protein n=1 Tax=Nocardioides sp. TaxID=35761 RepID=UPI0026056E8B|nr:hypothetical protein [Nocardioides sp.]
MAPTRHRQPQRRRFVPLLWISGAAAATVLVLGVNGTLSSWTSALITNDTDTAGAGNAVALSETDGTHTCTTASSTTNAVTCSTINKYGGNLAMTPGTASTVDVTFTNTGNGAATKFGYKPGTCTNTTGTLCASGSLTVAVSSSPGTTYAAGSAIAALGQSAVAPGSLADTTGASVSVAAGGSLTCRFVTTLISTAPATDAGASISQPILWTLAA